jgi:ribosomal-protein-alanine N-acetyltransferase
MKKTSLPTTDHPEHPLREILPSDFEALYRVDQICFEPGIAYSREALRRFLGIATAEGLVAELDGTIAGFAIGYLARGGAAHVVTLDVLPSFRRRSLGKALLEELLRRFSRAGAREARLEVSTENAGAIAFYRKLGFHRRRRMPDYYGRGRDALEMQKTFQVPSSRFQEEPGSPVPET